MLLAWIKLKRWIRSLGIAITQKTPINWVERIQELVDIANGVLDKRDRAKLRELRRQRRR
jgi:hypothetical protein